jgi:hypothetical protein
LGDIERSGAAPLSSPTIMERIERERASLLPPTLWEKIARERPGLLERANRPLSARAARARP